MVPPPKPKKWKKEDVLEAIEDGRCKMMKHSDYETIIAFVVDGTRVPDIVKCTLCDTFFAAGGNISRHARLHCPSVKHKKKSQQKERGQMTLEESLNNVLRKSECKELETALSRLFVSRGLPFTLVEADEMQTFMHNVVKVFRPSIAKELVARGLPNRRRLKALTERATESLQEQAHKEIVTAFARRDAAVLVDYGTVWHEYLSVYVSVLSEDFLFKTIPVGFFPARGGKDHEETFSLINQVLRRAGVSDDQISECALVGDGAANIRKCGSNNFREYVRCAAHALNNAGRHILEPYKDDKSKFTTTELATIDEMKEFLNTCKRIAAAIRRNKKMRTILPKKPSLGCETRWLSYLDVIEDLIELSDLIVLNRAHMTDDVSEEIHELFIRKMNKLKALKKIWEPLRAPVTELQSESKVTLHMVAPQFLKLLKLYETGQQTTDELDRTLCKSAFLSLTENSNQTLVDVHYAAVILSPKNKFMKNFDDDSRDKALAYIHNRYSALKESLPQEAAQKRARRDWDDSDDEDDDEIAAYLGLPKSRVEPDIYWKSSSEAFPVLSLVARTVLCIPASEASCERQFSLAAHAITKQRTSLSPESAEKVVLGRQLSFMYDMVIPVDPALEEHSDIEE